MPELTTIGRAELVSFKDLGAVDVPAKIDTGADSSSIWASQVTEKSDGLHCVFFGPGSPFYTGQIVAIKNQYSVTIVENSFGQKQTRYKIKLRTSVKGKLIRATFTLSDRSTKTYPVLLGRRLLRDKFLVDVAQGTPLHEAERAKTLALRKHLA